MWLNIQLKQDYDNYSEKEALKYYAYLCVYHSIKKAREIYLKKHKNVNRKINKKFIVTTWNRKQTT